MFDPFIRTRLLIGDEPLDRLAAAKVAVFGVGGVGGFCVEALARAGVGTLHLYDDDTVSESNLNRQIAALHSTIGQPKAEVVAARVRDINPACDVKAIRMFYLPQNADQVDLSQYDYVVDCIDTVAAKLELVSRCTTLQVKIISAMGSGNKLDPTAFEITDISKTQGCPLARVMRKELRKRGIQHLKVVYSREEPLSPARPIETEAPAGSDTRPGSTARRATPGSISFVPAAAGLVLASAVVRDLGQF
ncbi:tRNA threonylcarbamoyladenosine dehydratase [Pseudoflavonifractor phocaeensis]|uniref:tRNA threonylcarbamoyladenosine dehydratase n=1 Tax=Pseudoflavonifractor phocaeensis TaxID=1870988 RepID=UPI001F312861|nr:tRNA threonylcarbamoyladenosine dehydratase [Pseudoflavonifractor phocaeensis]MCF2595908.1 tRNA threonylcarbamoyladenosine dehydratase [Pseudoflavonifractor phocaeensis]